MIKASMYLSLGMAGVCAAYLGWIAGTPATESEIIERYATRFVEEAGPGAQLTDCAGRPMTQTTGYDLAAIVITCDGVAGQRTFVVDARGDELTQDDFFRRGPRT